MKLVSHPIFRFPYYACNDECRSCMCGGPMEAPLFPIIKRFFRGKSNLIGLDVGAHVGLYGAALHPLFKEMHSFEVENKSFKTLQQNKTIYPSIIPYQTGAWDCETNFNVRAGNAGGSLFINDTPDKSIKISNVVKVKRLDVIFKSKAFDFIKIDIEGAELHCLHGMKNILNNIKKCFMVIEYCKFSLNIYGSTTEEFFELLENSGFVALNFSRQNILNKSKIQDNFICNLILLKG